MIFLTLTRNWILPAVFTIVLVLYFRGRKGACFLLVLAASVLLNDLICHEVLKPLFSRIRPCQVLHDLPVTFPCSGSFSLPSNHASNSFTVATLFFLWNRNSVLLVFTLALLVSFSRVYLGVHYPTDVIGGAVCGIVVGTLGYRFYRTLILARWPLLSDPRCLPPLKESSS